MTDAIRARRARLQAMTDLYLTGLSTRAVGAHFGVSSPTVSAAVHLCGEECRPGSRPRGFVFSKPYKPYINNRARNTLIVNAYLAGQTINQIAAANSLSYYATRSILLRRGVSLRPKGRRPGQRNKATAS